MRRAERGHTTAKGYTRYSDGEMAHRRVWRKHNGPVPVGFFIHHIDGNKQNNDIANLELVTALVHKRIHSGCELRDGVWWKPCSVCGQFKSIDSDNWYISKQGWPLYGRCKPCHITIVVVGKRQRKLEARNKHP